MRTTLFMIRTKPNSPWKITTDLSAAERAAEKVWADLEPTEVRKLAGFLLGSLSSKRKADAARENGKKGGRPKKGAAKPKATLTDLDLFTDLPAPAAGPAAEPAAPARKAGK